MDKFTEFLVGVSRISHSSEKGKLAGILARSWHSDRSGPVEVHVTQLYLAFENSICTDYITEKFWRSLELGMVPVVYGGGDYLDEAPPNSYTDVRSFGSAKELTQYLLKLDKEPEECKQFFEWRNHFATVRGGGEWCKFCVALHEKKALITKPTKVNEDLDAWYWQRDPHSNQKKACQENPHFFEDN